MFALMTDWFLEKRTDNQHRFHVKFVLEISTVETAFAKRDKEQQLAFKLC
jgi:hypothetical protein